MIAYSVDELDARGRLNNSLGYVLKENGHITHALDVSDYDLGRLRSGAWSSVVCSPVRDEDQSVFVAMILEDGTSI
jgi:hypothetical protein